MKKRNTIIKGTTNNKKITAMREETARAVGDLKKCFRHIFHFWKQQYFNKSGSGIVVIMVKRKHMVPGSIPCKLFFS